MVDDGRIAFRPAVELSYLTAVEQNDLVETIGSEDAIPSLTQAIEMKKLSRNRSLTLDRIFDIACRSLRWQSILRPNGFPFI